MIAIISINSKKVQVSVRVGAVRPSLKRPQAANKPQAANRPQTSRKPQKSRKQAANKPQAANEPQIGHKQAANRKQAANKLQAANKPQIGCKFNNKSKIFVFKYFSEIKKVRLVKFEEYILLLTKNTNFQFKVILNKNIVFSVKKFSAFYT